MFTYNQFLMSCVCLYFPGNSSNASSQLRAPYSSYKRPNGSVDGVREPRRDRAVEGVREQQQYRDSLEEQDFVQKVSRFEYMTHGPRSPPTTAPGSPPVNYSSTSPPSRTHPPIGGVTYLHASPPGGHLPNGSVPTGERQENHSQSSHSPKKTTTISVVLQSPKDGENDEDRGDEGTGVREKSSDSVDSKQEKTVRQRPLSPAGPISPIRSVQHKTISFKPPQTTVTTSGNYASSKPQFAQTVGQTPPSPTLARRSPSPSLLRRTASPVPAAGSSKKQTDVSSKKLTSPPSPILNRKVSPVPPPKPSKETIAKATGGEPPPSPTLRRKLPSSPTTQRKFPVPSSPTTEKDIWKQQSQHTGNNKVTFPARSPSPSLTRKFPTAESQQKSEYRVPGSPKLSRKFPTGLESPRLNRKFPDTTDLPKPNKKLPTPPASPRLTRKFPGSPKQSRKFVAPPESPKLGRKFLIDDRSTSPKGNTESALHSKNIGEVPDSPRNPRKFLLPLDIPATLRDNPESPKSSRKFQNDSVTHSAVTGTSSVWTESKSGSGGSSGTSLQVSPPSPKITRKFPGNTKQPSPTAGAADGEEVLKRSPAIPPSPSSKRKGVVLSNISTGEVPPSPTAQRKLTQTPDSPLSLRRNAQTPPPNQKRAANGKKQDHVTPPPVPPHATSLNKKGVHHHHGEKVFTKDTAIVQRVTIPGFEKKLEAGSSQDGEVAASAGPDTRVVSGISTASSSSFTSVSSMSSTLSSETAINKESQSLPSVTPSVWADTTETMEINANTTESDMNGSLSGPHGDGVSLDDLEVDLDLDDLTGSQQDLKALHDQMVAERKKEQEMAALEKQRLEEILNMCAEYEKQIERERNASGSLDEHRETPIPRDDKRDSDCKSDGSSSRPESRNSMTKIKTNGSLTMLSSPPATHKEVSFEHWRRRSSNSSASEDDIGSENGTIKRRPNGHGLDNVLQSLQAEAAKLSMAEDVCDGAFSEDSPHPLPEDRVVSTDSKNESNNNLSPESSSMRLQLVKIGDGAYAGPVMRSVSKEGPNANLTSTEINSGGFYAGFTSSTSPVSENRSPRTPRSFSSDLRSPNESDGGTRQQLATPSSSGVETSSDLSLNKIEVSNGLL